MRWRMATGVTFSRRRADDLEPLPCRYLGKVRVVKLAILLVALIACSIGTLASLAALGLNLLGGRLGPVPQNVVFAIVPAALTFYAARELQKLFRAEKQLEQGRSAAPESQRASQED